MIQFALCIARDLNSVEMSQHLVLQILLEMFRIFVVLFLLMSAEELNPEVRMFSTVSLEFAEFLWKV